MIKKIAVISYASIIAFALIAGVSFAPKTALAGCCSFGGNLSQDACTTDDDCRPPAGGAPGGTCNLSATCTVGSSGGGTATPTPTPVGSKPTAGALENPLAGVCNGAEGQQCVQLVIGNVIKAALGIVGSIALLMMTYGGFLWLTSMGNSDRVEKGKNTLIWASLGLALIFGAYALTNYIIDIINK